MIVSVIIRRLSVTLNVIGTLIVSVKIKMNSISCKYLYNRKVNFILCFIKIRYSIKLFNLILQHAVRPLNKVGVTIKLNDNEIMHDN